MYLEDGREIYESDEYPGYYIDANTGNFCNEEGHYVGGNIDNGDKPGWGIKDPLNGVAVYVSRTGRQYYPRKTKTATIAIMLSEAVKRGYRPSRSYTTSLRRKSIRR